MNHLLGALDDVRTAHLLGLALFAFLFARGLRVEPAASMRSARWLLVRVSVAATFFLGMVAGLNSLVNPFGIYATRLFEPIVLHSRSEKMQLYRAARPRPEIVVLGSSSSFAMPPAYIRARTG